MESFLAPAATDGTRVVEGRAVCELRTFELERSAIYLYDLAVAESHRLPGICPRKTPLNRNGRQGGSPPRRPPGTFAIPIGIYWTGSPSSS